jgi:transketolase
LEVVSVGRLPLPEVPAWLVDKIEETGSVLTVEEHVAAGGLGEALARALWNRLGKPVRLRTLSAERYPSGLYGSQRWHQEESGLAGPRLKATIAAFLGETP